MAEQWEYKVTHGAAYEHELNALGAAGWELTGVVNDVDGTVEGNIIGSVNGSHGDIKGSASTTVTLIFKRRKP